MLNVAATNKLDGGRVLVVTTKSSAPNNPREYYSVKENDVDEFIKDRKYVDYTDKFQKVTSSAISVIGGFAAGAKVKSNRFVKGALGVAVGFCLYNICDMLDTKLDEYNKKRMLKRHDAEDITKKIVSNYQQH